MQKTLSKETAFACRAPFFLRVLPALAALLLLPCAALAGAHELWWEDAQLQARQGHYQIVDRKQLQDYVDQEHPPLLVDVRADYEYRRGHIPGAKHMEFDLGDSFMISEDKKQHLRELIGPDQKRPVVFYCRSFR